MKKGKSFLIPAIFMLILLIPVSISFKKDYEVYKNGNIVKVKVVKLPEGTFSRKKAMYFELYDSIYSKSISMNTRNSLHIGDEIELRYLQGNSHILFPYENPLRWDLFTIGLMVLCSIASFYYAFKK